MFWTVGFPRFCWMWCNNNMKTICLCIMTINLNKRCIQITLIRRRYCAVYLPKMEKFAIDVAKRIMATKGEKYYYFLKEVKLSRLPQGRMRWNSMNFERRFMWRPGHMDIHFLCSCFVYIWGLWKIKCMRCSACRRKRNALILFSGSSDLRR